MASYRIAIIPGDGFGNEVASEVNTPGMGERIRPMKSVMHSRKPFSMNRLKETLSRPAKAG
jgi:isocitrate/isopropylmalate dehydrogenase